jgi:transcriptional regulator with XRE-family HTH domain
MRYKEILKKENITEAEIADMLGMKLSSFQATSARARYINFIERLYNRINEPLRKVLERIENIEHEIINQRS